MVVVVLSTSLERFLIWFSVLLKPCFLFLASCFGPGAFNIALSTFFRFAFCFRFLISALLSTSRFLIQETTGGPPPLQDHLNPIFDLFDMLAF